MYEIFNIIEIIKQNAAIIPGFGTVNFLRITFFLAVSIFVVIEDIRHKKVTSVVLIASTAASLIFWLFINRLFMLYCLVGISGTICVFLLIYFLSGRGIGLGDMFYLCFFAGLFGHIFVIIAFLAGFWTGFIVLIVPYLLKIIDNKTKIPFIPFLFFGCSISIVLYFIL